MTAAKIPKRKAHSEWIKSRYKSNSVSWVTSPGPGPQCFHVRALGEGRALKVVHGLSPPTPCSYCHLETTFSIYVYGAFPLPFVHGEITMILLLVTVLLSVWLAYMVPKLLHTEHGHRFRRFWVGLRRRCRQFCACFR